MIRTIRTSKITKVVSSYLAIQLIISTIQPSNLFALTGGPSQPEFNSFTPIGTSDMVDLASGDFNYNIPIMDVGGYPLNLAYNSGVTMDQEASWVGLGWNLNVGQIARQVRGLPDDFKGDSIRYQNDMEPIKTIGVNANVSFELFGVKTNKIGVDLGVGIGVQYNNYNGVSVSTSIGPSFSLGKENRVNVGVAFSSSEAEGTTVSPSIGLSNKEKIKGDAVHNAKNTLGVSFNSRKGLENASFTHSRKRVKDLGNNTTQTTKGGITASYSFNDQSYTPTKRAGLESENFTFSADVGPVVAGAHPSGRLTGFGSYQGIRDDERSKLTPVFGYENTQYDDGSTGVLDFNRENDGSFTKNTTMLPITNYTYDLYAIQGQGIGGQFRPHRSQVGHVYDQHVRDYGFGGNFGVEIGIGYLAHVGVDYLINSSKSYTKNWTISNAARSKFKESPTDSNGFDYEPVYFSALGELSVDTGGTYGASYTNQAIRVGLDGYGAASSFGVKPLINGSSADYAYPSIDSKIKRSARLRRNQAIHKVTQKEAKQDAFVYSGNAAAADHHTVGLKIVKPDGSTYVFGEAAYNIKKVEATFDMSGSDALNCETGLITGIGTPVKRSRKKKSDGYLNKITTPPYAHSYLLSSVLSSDYEDIDNNGPTITDLGSYTKFYYNIPSSTFHWRVPYDVDAASYNEGLKSRDNDQKGNYIYGEKEIRYLQKIETKTHIAYFKLKKRKDGRGARGERENQATAGYQNKIDKIYLFSRPEIEAQDNYEDLEAYLATDADDDSSDNIIKDQLAKLAIKTAHFKYNYSLCPGVQNNLEGGGKLTLEKVFFTYRDSNMGMYTPYEFHYEKDFQITGNASPTRNNPSYHLKGYDVWGNYLDPKEYGENPGCGAFDQMTAAEFPYTPQDKEYADLYANSWTMQSIDLPSGGTIKLSMESDDYQLVQNKRAMRMFNVVGAGYDLEPTPANLNKNKLYDSGTDHVEYLYLEVNDDPESKLSASDYIGNLQDKPIQFRMLLNMADNNSQYDYVSGYFLIKNNNYKLFKRGGKSYLSVRMEPVRLNGRKLTKENRNPISAAGWYFGRKYLNNAVFSDDGESFNGKAFKTIVKELALFIPNIIHRLKGANRILEGKGCARFFNPTKSWVRLQEPTKRKFGGGLRVRKIQMEDNWDVMTGYRGTNKEHLYKQFYGQEYSYTNEDGSSNGVATFEPASSRENPFIEPIYNKITSGKDKMLTPKESNYVEKPFGQDFFPSPKVTYARVSVKNLSRYDEENPDKVIKKHATGTVVSEFYTTKNYPTLTDYTNMDGKITPKANILNILKNILRVSVKNEMTFSQGYVVETNDMNGKEKSQRVYKEGDTENFISGVDYNYSTKEDGTLNNELPVISKSGVVRPARIGVTYDVINDFRENFSETETVGVNMNTNTFLIAIFPAIVPVPLPNYSLHRDRLRVAVTTKVIHKTGILKEKVAYDVGAQVSTENLAWDATTGQVLLTKTVNEYDNAYYNMSYPAYWKYDGMGQASKNLGVEGYLKHKLEATGETRTRFAVENLVGIPVSQELPFYPGDVLLTESIGGLSDALKDDLGEDLDNYTEEELLWVAQVNTNGTLTLMNSKGNIINEDCSPNVKGDLKFKVVRSGYRNMAMASMASVTSQLNPIDINADGTYNNINEIYTAGLSPKVVNASAVLYNDYWKPQDQLGLPRMSEALEAKFDLAINNPGSLPFIESKSYGFNPYLYNARGDWRAVESYAYLNKRTSSMSGVGINPNLQDDGYFTRFNPFYKLTNNTWEADKSNWTSASTVTQYSPYGVELENKDALGRYSSALYGYGKTLPTAVASNNAYREIAFDGFEDAHLNERLKQSSAVVESIDYSQEDPIPTYFTRDHFSFNTLNEETAGNGVLSSDYAHTGTKSYKVTGDKAQVTKALTPYQYKPKEFECLESDVQQGIIKRDLRLINEYREYVPFHNRHMVIYELELHDLWENEKVYVSANYHINSGWCAWDEAEVYVCDSYNNNCNAGPDLDDEDNGWIYLVFGPVHHSGQYKGAEMALVGGDEGYGFLKIYTDGGSGLDDTNPRCGPNGDGDDVTEGNSYHTFWLVVKDELGRELTRLTIFPN